MKYDHYHAYAFEMLRSLFTPIQYLILFVLCAEIESRCRNRSNVNIGFLLFQESIILDIDEMASVFQTSCDICGTTTVKKMREAMKENNKKWLHFIHMPRIRKSIAPIVRSRLPITARNFLCFLRRLHFIYVHHISFLLSMASVQWHSR